MSKVGLLTFQRVMNYGGALQCLALQETLSRMGHDVEVIDYACNALRDDELPSSFLSNRTPGQFAKWVMQRSFLKDKYRAFGEFRRRYLHMGDACDRNSISMAVSDLDGIVVGSDQVWNPLLTGRDTTYLLDFDLDGGVNKVSYAASIGLSSLPIDIEAGWISRIGAFDEIGVRESTAVDYLASHGVANAHQVMDPTFLVGNDYWANIAEPPQLSAPYMFVYLFVPVWGELLAELKRVAAGRGLELVVLHSSARLIPGVVNVRGCSPEEFLGYVKFADCVCTSSFHGTCFSLIFNRDFISYCPEEQTSTSSRVTDLLEKAGLSSRASKVMNGDMDPIAWDGVNCALRKGVEESLDFLKTAVA